MTPNFDWQEAAVRAIVAAQVSALPHYYAVSPTGTGKTKAMFKMSTALTHLSERVMVVTVGRAKLVRQHTESFISFGCERVADDQRRIPQRDFTELEAPDGRHIIIATWQGLASLAKKVKLGKHDLNLRATALIFDECHLGGSNKGSKGETRRRNSIEQVIDLFKPEMKIYVTATHATSDEDLLGKKEGHIYVHTMHEAYDAGLMNDTRLIEVHTGTTMTVVDERRKRMAKEVETTSLSDSAAIAEKLEASIEWKTFEAKQEECLAREMIDLYFARHGTEGEQAMFFFRTIDQAEKAVGYFRQRAKRNGKRLTAACINSTSNTKYKLKDENDNSIDYVEFQTDRFERGDLTCIFVVGMLQEGFDHPTLRLAFDCAFFNTWDEARKSRFRQKIGRLTRIADGKRESLYYYARTLTDFYNTKLLRKQEPSIVHIEDEQPVVSTGPLTDEELLTEKESASVTSGLLNQEGTDAVRVVPPEVENVTIDGEDDTEAGAADGDDEEQPIEMVQPAGDDLNVGLIERKPKVVTLISSRFTISSVRDHSVVCEYDYREILGCLEDVEERAARILSGNKPPRGSVASESADYVWMIKYAKKNPEFAAALKLRGWLKEEDEPAEERAKRILARSEPPGYSVSSGRADYLWMKWYAKKNPEFAAELAKRGWYEAKPSEPAEERAKRILARSEPPRDSVASERNDYVWMQQYAKKNSEFAAELRKRGWYKEAKPSEPAEERARRILARSEPPRGSVASESADYVWMKKYAKKNPEFTAELRKRGWFNASKNIESPMSCAA